MTLKRLSVVLLACLTLSACGGVDPNSPLGQRKAIFKQMLKTGEDLGGMLRGRIPFDGPRFTEGAIKLDNLSREPWKHFPQVKEQEHTSATDDVWQKQARFQELARALEAATGELVIASKVQPYKASNLGPAVQKVEDACSACHKEFRDH
ncbi:MULTISPECIES: c-type cytochrome [Pseudomonas]|uniref:Cytochrome c556 n=2 Tax=Pseudomonas chlororaphis TaxID=587753 RepID=A0AAD1E8V3_9PSED|nr:MULTISPECIES: cytochrome c [Pseudomonas]AZD89004.1 Cytochrome c556 [Pseudomonas chlororaphis subsp. aureofaciens]AZD95462.1 Cytochrome c556 [Pseudomonas chlororaphis subsp. aureofaciens]AZE01751.1 Cytochrome c556 [Pseudomonas chlororaphis subsp. aureofaciens]AZE07870.1 Cytochrome c556 [Pseudomonas chlororaphis subsp. aureofaciens]AZE14051.1 Cytochrome c556 [Pseudomonas chlororaphis subsp. aureofaciens]